MKDDADGTDASGWLASQFGQDPDTAAEHGGIAEEAGHRSRRAARAARRRAESGQTESATPATPAQVPPAAPPVAPPATPPVAAPTAPATPAAPAGGGFRWNLGTPTVPQPREEGRPDPLVPDGAPDPFLPDDPSLPEPVLPHPGRALPTELFSTAEPGEPTVPLVSRRTFRPAEAQVPVWSDADAVPELPTDLLPAGVTDRDSDDSPLAALFREHEHRYTAPAEEVAPTAAYGIPRASQPTLPVHDAQPSARRRSVTGEGMSKNQRLLLWVAGVLLAIVVLIALFFAGTKLPELFGAAPAAAPVVLSSPTPTVSPSPSITPSPSPSPQLMAASTGPRPPGDYPWEQLAGGECLAPYTSPWAEDFTVVDCAAGHPAQLLHRGVFGPDDASAYPGVKALQAKSVTLCSAPKLLDFGAASAYRDLQFEASYAATKEEWAAGHRDYFCFVSRASGADLTGSVVR